MPTPTVTGLGRPAEQPGLGGPVRVRRRLRWSQPELHSLHWQCGTGRRRRVRANRHRDWHCRPLARSESAGLAPGRDLPGPGHVTIVTRRPSRSLTAGSVARPAWAAVTVIIGRAAAAATMTVGPLPGRAWMTLSLRL